jgi:hypothetical protein
MANKALTVNKLIKELTEMKKLGLADAIIIAEGCDCDNEAVRVEADKSMTYVDGKLVNTKIVRIAIG